MFHLIRPVSRSALTYSKNQVSICIARKKKKQKKQCPRRVVIMRVRTAALFLMSRPSPQRASQMTRSPRSVCALQRRQRVGKWASKARREWDQGKACSSLDFSFGFKNTPYGEGTRDQGPPNRIYDKNISIWSLMIIKYPLFKPNNTTKLRHTVMYIIYFLAQRARLHNYRSRMAQNY